MADPTFIACPHCGEPVVMTAMQHDLFRGRALACAKCAKQFTVDPQRTPLFTLSPNGRAYLSSPPPAAQQPAQSTVATPPAVPAAHAPHAPAPPPDAQQRAAASASAGRWTLPAVVLGSFALLAGVLAALVLPPMNAARAAQRQLVCASNLRQIGVALQVYAAGNDGRYPDTLDRLLGSNLVQPEHLLCPATDHTPVPIAKPQPSAANATRGTHLSYVYVGNGMTTAAALNPQTIVLYEPLTHHGPSNGTHVLYANGSVAFLAPPAAGQTIAALPPPLPPTANVPRR